MRLLCIGATIALTACAAKPLTMDDLQTFHRGLSAAKVESILEREPTSSVSVDYEGHTYMSEMYPMQTGTEMQSMVICTLPAGCLPVIYDKAVAVPYLVVYSGDELKTWGYVQEFNKHVDSEFVSVSISSALMAAHKIDLERQERERKLAKIERRKAWHGF